MLACENTYVVEKLLDRRNLEGRIEYLVKWKDYPNSMATWEPRDSLMETMEHAVEKFDADVDRDEGGSMRSSSPKRLSKKSGKKASKTPPKQNKKETSINSKEKIDRKQVFYAKI